MELAKRSRRAPDDLAEDAKAGCLVEFMDVRGRLDNRYADIKSGRSKLADGEGFFEKSRRSGGNLAAK